MKAAGRGLRPARAAAGGAILLAAVLAACQSTRGPSDDGEAFYSSGTRIPVTLAQDRIAVLAVRGVPRSELESLARAAKLEIAEGDGRDLYILAAGSAAGRPELEALARQLLEGAPHLVAQAGLVGTPAGGGAPFLLSDEFVVSLRAGADAGELERLNARHGVTVVRRSPFAPERFVLRPASRSPSDALRLAARYYGHEKLLESAHPNLIQMVAFTQACGAGTVGTPGAMQWHHDNAGDTDIDSTQAWAMARAVAPAGTPGPVIAVFDDGFAAQSGDLAGQFQLWSNPEETAATGDEDGNLKDDHLHGWDFSPCDRSGAAPTCGRPDPVQRPVTPPPGGAAADAAYFGVGHGTAVAGLVAANGKNSLGITGSCPDCRLMLLGFAYTPAAQADAFDYAREEGAQIITNSWHPAHRPEYSGMALDVVRESIEKAATEGRQNLGMPVFFAMANSAEPFCEKSVGSVRQFVSMDEVIAVATSTSEDRFDSGGSYGDCVDLLAPSFIKVTGTGSRITTTDLPGLDGYNKNQKGSCTAVQPADRCYTSCFSGNSAATPIAAGVAGLVLGVAPGLTRLQLQRVMQDTADKIEDTKGSYAPLTGYSTANTHAFGRVNASEAVRLVAHAAAGGRGGVDLFFRDNHLDWGNTEQPSNVKFESPRGFIPHWVSMDIKVAAHGSTQPAPTTSAEFDAFGDQTPSAETGAHNKVYVRVRNRGPVTAPGARVKLMWSQFGTALPPLPAGFWDDLEAGTAGDWHPLKCAGTGATVCKTDAVPYSGASVAGTADDGAQVVAFEFPAPEVDASRPNHFCLIAVVDSPEDPAAVSTLIVDEATPRYNNVTHRNYANLATDASGEPGVRMLEFRVRNPFRRPIETYLRVNAPSEWQVRLELSPEELAPRRERPPGVLPPPRSFQEPFRLGPGQSVQVRMWLRPQGATAGGRMEVIQFVRGRPLGGLTVNLPPGLRRPG